MPSKQFWITISTPASHFLFLLWCNYILSLFLSLMSRDLIRQVTEKRDSEITTRVKLMPQLTLQTIEEETLSVFFSSKVKRWSTNVLIELKSSLQSDMKWNSRVNSLWGPEMSEMRLLRRQNCLFCLSLILCPFFYLLLCLIGNDFNALHSQRGGFYLFLHQCISCSLSCIHSCFLSNNK